MKQIDNFIRNPTNNDIIAKIKEKYLLSYTLELNLTRKEKKEIRNKLILAYKYISKQIKFKNKV